MPDPPDFTETNPDPIESDLLTTYEKEAGKTLFDGNPVRLVLEAVVYVLAVQRSQIQGAAEQNLVQFATGDNLDFLGKLYALSRKPVQKTTCTLQFSTDGTAAQSDITIPAGTKVATQSGDIEFATDEEVILQSRDTSVTVGATATTPGADHNRFVAGQVSEIVNPIAGVAAAQNTDKTSGGADVESDESFRERIREAPETFAVGGPAQAYSAVAVAAVPGIKSAAIQNPSPGQVDVYVLREGGNLPTQTDLDDVELALSQEDTRPLTDTVSVKAPTEVQYDIDLTYVIFERFEGEKTRIDDDVTTAVDDYVAWQRLEAGRDVNPDDLERRLLQIEGIKRVGLTSPAVQTLDETQVARLDARAVSFDSFETE